MSQTGYSGYSGPTSYSGTSGFPDRGYNTNNNNLSFNVQRLQRNRLLQQMSQSGDLGQHGVPGGPPGSLSPNNSITPSLPQFPTQDISGALPDLSGAFPTAPMEPDLSGAIPSTGEEEANQCPPCPCLEQQAENMPNTSGLPQFSYFDPSTWFIPTAPTTASPAPTTNLTTAPSGGARHKRRSKKRATKRTQRRTRRTRSSHKLRRTKSSRKHRV
jgi:hypothetical protein